MEFKPRKMNISNIPIELLQKIDEGIDNSIFFECVRLLASEEKELSTKAALQRLSRLRASRPSSKRHKYFLTQHIDSLTQGISLEKANLSFAVLTNINLSNADLSGADLTDAKLIEANLSEAKLTNANLSGTNLTDAKLYGTDLERVDRYDTAIFKGVKYNKDTKFPPDFDLQKAGCIKD